LRSKADTIWRIRVISREHYITKTEFFNIVGHSCFNVDRNGSSCEAGLVAVDIYIGAEWLYLKVV